MQLTDTAYYFLMYGVLLFRYVLIAGLAFAFFYLLFPKKFARVKLQPHFPKKNDYAREVGYSLFTFVVFAAIAVVLARTPLLQYTRIYPNISDYGWPWFFTSVLVALVIHDAYFYFTHRLMHHPRLFKVFHLVHHKSVNPTPWAAFSFHPLEAVVEGCVIFVIAFLIPVHEYALLLFLLFMTVYNVYGHLGYEIYPGWLVRSRVGRWLNTSTNHNMHHKYFKGNYGLYFRFWDELFGTTHPNYQQTVTSITTKTKT